MNVAELQILYLVALKVSGNETRIDREILANWFLSLRMLDKGHFPLPECNNSSFLSSGLEM